MVPISLAMAGRALSFVSPDDRDTWIRMGMALKAEFGDAARDTWIDWSAASDAFDRGAALSSWKSFKNGGKVGIGSLLAEAKREGFMPDRADVNVSPEKLAADKIAREERAAKAEKDRLARAEAAANRAQSQWRMAAIEGASPYLERKQVQAEACRFLPDGGVIVPMLRYDFDKPVMVGKQAIAADGTKKYSGGMDKHGAACRLGEVPTDGDVLLMGEGYATGLSVRMAVQHRHPFFVAFDASGLLAVAKILRVAYPSSPILFCADDDYLTGGKGLEKAQAAAAEVGNASVLLPTFSAPRRASKSDESLPMLTDFNDLHVAESLDMVAAQISKAIDVAPPTSHPPALTLVKNSPAPLPDRPESASTETGADAAGKGNGEGRQKKPRKEYPQSHWDTVNYLIDNFVLIYGDDTAWDRQNRMIIKIAHLRLAYTSDAVKFWLNNPDRRMVNKDCVVFDPTGKADPDETVNLYHGFGMSPKPGKCERILELLHHLCGGDAEVMAWVLRWIAYPLQNKGAKMRTSIIIHGDEGSGKNLFWENVVRRIYGEYGGVIGNAQIESQFNEWASKKLFFVADEVVTRNELRQLKGKLKHMVTGETIMINPKGFTERAEANHMNFVFLSNELQPLALDKTDRRYLVLWTPPNREPEFYKSVADEINSGGVEAFYDYCMKVPVGDFNEHTKPLVTEAKTKLIGLGLSPPEKFYREWAGGFLPLPYMCCSAMQLYLGFCRWCHLNGERFPMTQTMFGRTIDRVGFGEVRRAIIKYDLGSDVKQRTAYLVGEQPADKSRTQWVEDASSIFEAQLKKYRHVYDQPSE